MMNINQHDSHVITYIEHVASNDTLWGYDVIYHILFMAMVIRYEEESR